MKRQHLVAGFSGTYFSWSLAGIVISMAAFGPAALIWQSICSLLILSAVRSYKNISFSWVQSRRAIVHSVTRVAGMSFFLYAFLHLKMGVVDTIIASGMFLSIYVFARRQGEKPNRILIIPLSCSIIGIAFVCDIHSLNDITQFNFYLLSAFAAMIFIATSNYYWRKQSQNIEPVAYLTYMHFWVFVIAVPTMLVLKQLEIIPSKIVPSWQQAILIIVSVVVGACGDFLFTAIQKHSTYVINAVFSPAGAIFTPILAFIVKGETLALLQIVGIAVVAISIGSANYLQHCDMKVKYLNFQRPIRIGIRRQEQQMVSQ